jgi:diguanylate cyclase (GGDEF)-like protein
VPADAQPRTKRALRVAAALLVVGIIVGGGWGALSMFRAAKASRQASALSAAYDDVRYAAIVQLGADRSASARPLRARDEFFTGAFRAEQALGAARRNAGARDTRTIARLTTLQQRSLAAAARAYGIGPRSQAATTFFDQADYSLRRLGAEAKRASSDLRLRDAGRYPTDTSQRIGFAMTVLVFLAGLMLGAVTLVRLVGYSRRIKDARQEELERLERAALTDNLTDLRNHRAFHEDLKREIERRNRTGVPFSVLMVDLNGLKQINDTHGHQAGDECIRATGDCLKAAVRGMDTAYRTGGDEFMVILPGERSFGALTLAGRIHAEAARRPVPVSVTIGIAESSGTEGRNSLIRHADLALYEAKRAHLKNVVYTDGLEPGPRTVVSTGDERQHQKTLATALARAVDAKDAGTRNHCETVAELCALLGAKLGLSPERIQKLRLAGLLHDVGKIGIADAILQKPDELEEDEVAAMAAHARIGHNIVSAADLEEEAEWVLRHHERWDGSGYPEGLLGEEIPLESRIILVADAFEAITAHRPYRPARTPEEALEELSTHAGTQFDPTCVAALSAIFGNATAAPDLDELGARRRDKAAESGDIAKVVGDGA